MATSDRLAGTILPNESGGKGGYVDPDLTFDYGLKAFPGTIERFRLPPDGFPAEGGIVCIGSSYTFGRFVEKPFPALLAEKLGRPVVNLGMGGAMPEAYLRIPGVLKLIEHAAVVVAQVMSARYCANSEFGFSSNLCNHALNLKARRLQEGKMGEYWDRMRHFEPDRYTRLYFESQATFLNTMREIYGRCRGKAIHLWLSTRMQAPAVIRPALKPLFYPSFHPQMVTDELDTMIREYADKSLDVCFPQKEWKYKRKDGTEGSTAYYPPPAVHEEVATKLAAMIQNMG